MSAREHPKSASSALNEHTNSRPKTLLQRLSSGFVPVLPCPYDPKTYHSFNSIEKRGAFYGMRGPQMKHSEPCLACRTGSIDAHISIDRGKMCHSTETSSCDNPQPTHSAVCSSSDRLGSRPATPERSVKRVVSRRKSSRGSSSKAVSSAPKVESILDPSSGPTQELVTSLAEMLHTHDHDVDDKEEIEENRVCPKLKSRNDLSYSEDVPLVQRNETPLHAIDARTAPTTHLTGRSITTNGPPGSGEELECSGTVDYGETESCFPVVLTRATPVSVTVATAKQVHVTNEPARLRGGSGREQGLSKGPGSKLKRWKMLCHSSSPEDVDPDSDARPSQARVEEPIRVVETRETLRENLQGETNEAAPLAAQTSSDFSRTRSVHATRSDVADHPNRMSVTTTISGPPSSTPSPSSDILSRLLLKYRYRQKPVESPATQPKQNPLSRSHSRKVPHLRGGAESPERTPPSLYWLAGGTGKKPVSINGWKQSRPKKRMSGLFGMAVFGSKYGQEYKVQANVSGDLGIGCTTSVKVTVEGTEVVNASGGTDAPQPKSRSGSYRSEAAEAKPVEEAKMLEEAKPVEEAKLVEDAKSVEEAATVADEAALIEPAPAREVSENVEETVPIETDKAIERALSPPPADPADDVPLRSGALPVETSKDVDETAPIESEEAVQRALSPPPADPADDVPLCSGALPVETVVHTPQEDISPVHHNQEEKKEHDAASEGPKE